MKNTKMLLSCAMMLMFSVSIFAGQKQEKCPGNMILMQEEQYCNEAGKKQGKCLDCICVQQDGQYCNEQEPLFMCDGNMRKGKKFKRPHFKKDSMRNFNKNCNPFKEAYCEKMLDKLNLTDKQKEDLKALEESTMKKQQELMQVIMNENKTINEELLKNKYDEKVIKKSVKNIKVASNKLTDNQIKNKKSLKKILTNEQYVEIFKAKTIYDILAERLNLSNEQKEKVTTILKDSDTKRKELIEKKITKECSLKEELEKENCKKDTVSQLTKDISKLSDELFKLHIDTKMELKSVLSFEQYSQMYNFQKKDEVKQAPKEELQ